MCSLTSDPKHASENSTDTDVLHLDQAAVSTVAMGDKQAGKQELTCVHS